MSSSQPPGDSGISCNELNGERRGRRIAAVTGASGFIGSYLCAVLLDRGYTVRACVRPGRKAVHLPEGQNNHDANSGGSLEIHPADMSVRGAYDSIFEGCTVVFHVAGNFGTDYHSLWKKSKTKRATPASAENPVQATPETRNYRLPPADQLLRNLHRNQTTEIHDVKDNRKLDALATLGVSDQDDPQQPWLSYDHAVYESYITPMEWILESVKKNSATVRRVVYTSSGAAGGTIEADEPANEADILDNSYGAAKRECERLLYAFCGDHNADPANPHDPILGLSVCPCIVMGPPTVVPLHDTVYQHRWADMLRGRYVLEQSWEIADVRDVAEAHARLAEAPNVCNGTRVWVGSEPCQSVESLLESIASRDPYERDPRLDRLRQNLTAPANADIDDSESNSDSNSKRGSDDGSRSDSVSSSSRGSGSDSPSTGSDDSFGVSEWDLDGTTTWSDPTVLFRNKAVDDNGESDASYKPRTPRETLQDTTHSILEQDRWKALGRDYSLTESLDYYTVAEMDGCSEEMEWLEGYAASLLASQRAK